MHYKHSSSFFLNVECWYIENVNNIERASNKASNKNNKVEGELKTHPNDEV